MDTKRRRGFEWKATDNRFVPEVDEGAVPGLAGRLLGGNRRLRWGRAGQIEIARHPPERSRLAGFLRGSRSDVLSVAHLPDVFVGRSGGNIGNIREQRISAFARRVLAYVVEDRRAIDSARPPYNCFGARNLTEDVLAHNGRCQIENIIFQVYSLVVGVGTVVTDVNDAVL
ncbi:hypothetical protein B0H11DRAFT_2008703 [Mycena galericulata]|nr:hypothetical protein B0H11DRAFT_2008703 [Mycena galericulata]